MFAFFRRQSKKNGGGNKKSKKQSGFAIINDLQCVPIDKYEINFCNDVVLSDSKPDKVKRTRLTMGNFESNPKKSTESPTTPASVSFNNNVYRNMETKPTSWTRDPLGDHETDVKRWNEQTDETPRNDLLKNVVQEPKTTDVAANEPVSTQSEANKSVVNDKQMDLTAEKRGDNSPATEYNGCAKPTLSKEASCDDVNSQEDFGTAPSSPTAECVNQSSTSGRERSLSSARDAFFKTVKPVFDLEKPSEDSSRANEVVRQRKTSDEDAELEETVKEDRVAHEEKNHRGSPSREVASVSTEEDLLDFAVLELENNIRNQPVELETPVLPEGSGDDVGDLSNRSDVKPNQEEDAKVADVPQTRCNLSNTNTRTDTTEDSEYCDRTRNSKHISKNSELICENPTEARNTNQDVSSRSNSTQTIPDLTACYSAEITDSNYFQTRPDIASDNPDSSLSYTSNNTTDEDDEFEEAESKQEERKKFEPFCPPGQILHSGGIKPPHRIQIPDITITESSDSEGESDYEIEDYQDRCYERAYPSILYDITEVDEPFSDASDVELSGFDDKRNIVHQETKFQEQIKTLKSDIESKDSENMQLKGKINDLQRDIVNKTWGMDRLHAELASFQTEADCVRKKLLKVEEDLVKYKNKNTELNEELLKTLENEGDNKKVNGLQKEVERLKLKIKDLQKELELAKAEKNELLNKLSELEDEKREKIKTMEIALDETLREKQKMQARFNQEYEKLRTLNTEREQQLLNDFEWKLREVELNCKRKLEEKETSNEEKIKLIKKHLEYEIVQLKEQLKEVEKIKSYQAEVSQLRGLTEEQDRSLRMAMRTTEQLQNNERSLNDEIDKLRTSLEKERAHLATVQGIHSREIAEKDRKYSFKLEQQKNEINAQWEDKARREAQRLKLEVEKMYKDDKRNILEEAKMKTEKQLKENNQIWERKLLESKKEFENMQQKLAEKEDSYRNELLRLQTNSDRDMLELRRKLDKMDLSYQEKLEKKQEEHDEEMENLREEYEKRIQQSEQNWSQQISSTRATLELVKEQLQREAEAQMEALNKKYLLQLEQQYDRLVKEKEDAIIQVQEKYTSEMCALQNQLNEELKAHKIKEIEMLRIIDQLQTELNDKINDKSELQENHDVLHDTISELQAKIVNYEKLTREAEIALQKQEAEHATVVSRLKDCYENEIKYWQSKIVPNQKEVPVVIEKSSSCEPAVRAEESRNNNVPNQSKSARRKARGRNRNQKNYQNRPQLTSQFSSSSL